MQAQAVEGVAVADLCRRVTGPRNGEAFISKRELEQWLVTSGFAVRVADGRLRPTRKAADVVVALSFD
jgi:hypothetical protein